MVNVDYRQLPYRSDTGGVSPIRISGRMRILQERLAGMTDEERAWRKKFLQSQILDHDEPKEIPQIYKELRNPIRRFYQWPLNQLENVLTPRIGRDYAWLTRRVVGAYGIAIACAYVGTYCALYYNRNNDWTTNSGFSFVLSRMATYPGDAGYPTKFENFPPDHFYDRGFSKSVLYDLPKKG